MKDYKNYWIAVPRAKRREPFMAKAVRVIGALDEIEKQVGGAEMARIVCLNDVLEASDLIESFKDFMESLGFKQL